MSNNLPECWISVPLDVVGRWGSGGTPKKGNKLFYGGDIPWLKIGDLSDGPVYSAEETITDFGLKNSSAKLLPENTVLLAMYGSIGKLGITKIECATNQAIAFCLHESRLIDIKFLFFGLFFLRQEFISQGQGGTQQNISQTILKKTQLPLAPLNEQKRIVDKIETLFSDLDKGEALLKQVQQQLGVYRQSVLKAAVTGDLVETALDEWQEYKIADLLNDIRYGTAKKCLYDKSKTPVLRIPNIAKGKVDLTDLKFTDFAESELNKLKIEVGDILLVRSNGSVSLVGLSAVVSRDVAGFAYAGYLIRLRLKREIIVSEFLNLFLHSPVARSIIELNARSTSGVHNINSDEVRSISIRVPSLKEQEEIVDKVDDIFSQIDALEKWCATELARSEMLRQSILKAAFSGELVPQDPRDEPASELLARIQAERASAEGDGNARKSAGRRGRKATA